MFSFTVYSPAFVVCRNVFFSRDGPIYIKMIPDIWPFLISRKRKRWLLWETLSTPKASSGPEKFQYLSSEHQAENSHIYKWSHALSSGKVVFAVDRVIPWEFEVEKVPQDHIHCLVNIKIYIFIMADLVISGVLLHDIVLSQFDPS